MKEEIVNIIVEKRLQGKDIPFWIKLLFPKLVEEVDPIVRMLKGNQEPIRQTKTLSTYKLVYTFISLIIILTITLFVWQPIGNLFPLSNPEQGGVKMEGNTQEPKESRFRMFDTTATTTTTSTTSTTTDPNNTQGTNTDPEKDPNIPPGTRYIIDPIKPPVEEE